jgi:SNF2 family DNA or RNA helicase
MRTARPNSKAVAPKIPKDVLRASNNAGMEAYEEGTKGKKKGGSSKQESKAKPKKQNTRGKKPKPTKPSGVQKKANKKTKAKGGRQKKDRNLENFDSIWRSDVFKDAAANEGGAEQPTVAQGNRQKALKQLIASVPEESRESYKSDTSYLDNAIKDFTGGGHRVKSDGQAGWKMKGMTSSLKHYQVLGAAFMRRRENSKEYPRGGLQADEMGLGSELYQFYPKTYAKQHVETVMMIGRTQQIQM